MRTKLMELYIWKWGTASNGNPIYNWSTSESMRRRLSSLSLHWPTAMRPVICHITLNPDEKAGWVDLDLVERSEFVRLLYESAMTKETQDDSTRI